MATPIPPFQPHQETTALYLDRSIIPGFRSMIPDIKASELQPASSMCSSSRSKTLWEIVKWTTAMICRTRGGNPSACLVCFLEGLNLEIIGNNRNSRAAAQAEYWLHTLPYDQPGPTQRAACGEPSAPDHLGPWEDWYSCRYSQITSRPHPAYQPST